MYNITYKKNIDLKQGIFKNIESGIDVEDIIKKMLEEYDIPGSNDEEKYEKASNDVNKFINEMKKAGIIEDGK